MGDLFSHPKDDAGARFNQSGWPGAGEGDRAVDIKRIDVDAFGVYKVRLELSGEGLLFGQRRNLIAETSGETEFLTLLTEYIPSMQSVPCEDKSLFASVYGAKIVSMNAEKAQARRVFIAGDSTVADQYTTREYYPFNSYAGWGQMLSAFLRRDAVCNMAHSGLTGRCFTEDGHWDIVKKYLSKGDLLLIQFGHNDQKRRYLQADQRYTHYISALAEEAVRRGAQPVLLSPVSRVPSRDEAGYFDLLLEHSEAVKRLASEKKLPFIDLHEYTFNMYTEMGEDCKALFRDMTHSNDPGAFKIAKHVASELKRFGLADISDVRAEFLLSDTAENPAKKEPSAIPVPYVDVGDVPDFSVVYEGVQKGLLDPCVLHMHPFEPLPRAQYIQLLFRAAGISGEPTDGVAPYNDVKPREFDASFAAACKRGGLVTGDYYRPDDLISAQEIDGLSAALGIDIKIAAHGDTPTKYEIIKYLLEVKANEARRK